MLHYAHVPFKAPEFYPPLQVLCLHYTLFSFPLSVTNKSSRLSRRMTTLRTELLPPSLTNKFLCYPQAPISILLHHVCPSWLDSDRSPVGSHVK